MLRLPYFITKIDTIMLSLGTIVFGIAVVLTCNLPCLFS